MRNFRFLSTFFAAALLFVGVACNNEEERVIPEDDKLEAYYVRATVTVATTEDLRKVTELNVGFVDLLNNEVNMSNEVAVSDYYQWSDKRRVRDLLFPINIELALDYSLLEGIDDSSTLDCMVDAELVLEFLNENGDVIKTFESNFARQWTPQLPVSENFEPGEWSCNYSVVQDAEGLLFAEEVVKPEL